MRKMNCWMVVICVVMAATKVSAQYEATWDSLQNYAVPAWYQDAKFGIFLHWGVYSVPAYGSEWYPSHMYEKGGDEYSYHQQTWGDPKKFGYKDFIRLFTAEKFDADQWAELFDKAGARYVVPVAEHHDGFAMYDSAHTKWNAVSTGPKRDVLGELAKACRARGMKVGASSHFAMNWDFYRHDEEFDTMDPAAAGLYNDPHPIGQPPSEKFLRHWYARTIDIVDKYQPDVLWFDFGFFRPAFEPLRRKIAAYYYNKGLEWDKGVVLNYKDSIYPAGTAVLDLERTRMADINPSVWQTDTSVSFDSWGYIERDKFKPVASLIKDLVDVVSKNGVLLLNVGPRADGTIPEEAQARLLAIGDWRNANGEAIYGTRPWLTYGEGPMRIDTDEFGEGEEAEYGPQDIRFTTKEDVLYAICLGWPAGTLKIQSLGERAQPHLEILRVSLLGTETPIARERTPEHLAITVPDKCFGSHAYPFKIELKGAAIGGLRVSGQGKTLRATVQVRTYGGEAFASKLALKVDDKPVARKHFVAQPGVVATVCFRRTVKKAGFHEVALGEAGFTTASKKIGLPVIDLAGEWLVKEADLTEWKARGLEDSGWHPVRLPTTSPEYTQERDFHWYRRTVVIPKEFEGCGLRLVPGKIDGSDETFFNGNPVGAMGKIPPTERPPSEDTRRYRVPPDLIRYGEANVIAIRIYGVKNCGPYADMGTIEYVK